MTPAQIKQLRKSRNETQKQFAVVVGVSVDTVSVWETGRHEPSALALRRLHEVRDTKKARKK